MNHLTEHDHDHDPDLQVAYDRLGSTLHPPVDGPARVEHRIAVRRRRRRAAGGVAALALVGGIGLAAVTTGGEPDRVVDPASPPSGDPVSTLATTMPDGTPYTFTGVEVTCEGRTILAQTPRRIMDEDGDQHLAEPFLYIEGLVDELPSGSTLQLPVDGPGSSDTYPLLLFFALDGDRGSNELSSAVGGATGTVEVVEATCGPQPRLVLTVDAVLGSELQDGEAMPLRGELR